MKNKKLVKGIVAGSLGLALLLGGGTFALWYQQDSVDSGAIESGVLSFTPGTPTWTVVGDDVTGATPTASETIGSIGDFRMVPGDTVTYKNTLAVKTQGHTLKAGLTVDMSDIVAGAGSDSQLATAIADSDKTQVAAGTTPTPTLGDIGTPVVISLTGSDTQSTTTVTVIVTLHFPGATNGDDVSASNAANWWDQAAQNQTVDLSKLTFTLQQTL